MADRRRTLGLRVAAARRARGFTQAELARASDLDRTALSKVESGRRDVSSIELGRLARALGRTADWFLADRAPAADPLGSLRRRRRSILAVAARHGARSIRVFGSVARREAGPDSDVDLLVHLEKGRSLFDQAALLADLRELLGQDVDVVTDEALRGPLRDRVLGDAVPL